MTSPRKDPSTAEALGALARSAAERAPVDEAAARAKLLRRAAETESAPARPRRRWLALIPALSVAGALSTFPPGLLTVTE